MSVHEPFTVEPLEDVDWVDPSRPARGVRLRSDAGALAIIENGDATIGYVAAFRVHAGGARGGHYHREKVETLTVLEGEMEVTMAEVTPRVAGARSPRPVASLDHQAWMRA